MQAFGAWLESSEVKDLHPLVRACEAIHRLLHIYPWTQHSGRVARLLGNYIMLTEGYLPVIVHSIERQRFYDALRHKDNALLELMLESLENNVETTHKFFSELETYAQRAS
jgi:Fic family protein